MTSPAERLEGDVRRRRHRDRSDHQDVPTSTVTRRSSARRSSITLDDSEAAATSKWLPSPSPRLLEQHYFRDQPWLFPQLARHSPHWLGDPDGDSPNVDHGDDTFPGLLLLGQHAARAPAEQMRNAIVAVRRGNDVSGHAPALRRPGTTTDVDFDTLEKGVRRPTRRSATSTYVAQDTAGSTSAPALEEMDEVHAYVKNQTSASPSRTPSTADARELPTRLHRARSRTASERRTCST